MTPRPSRTLVLPARSTLGLAALLVAMWYAGMSQSNGAAYLLCFLIASLAAVSTIHAWANLRGVTVRADRIAPVFAGDHVTVPLVVNAERGTAPCAIYFHGGEESRGSLVAGIADNREQHAPVRFHAKHRGCFAEVRIVATSTYPLGLFTARRIFPLRQTWYVYPQPSGSAPIPESPPSARALREGTNCEGDDYAGTRPWLPGESQRHIDWKAAARGQPLLTKQWAGKPTADIVLDWRDTPAGDIEQRLGQLVRWVQDSERSGANYGLSLPGTKIPPSRGSAQLQSCLRALAIFSPQEESA